MKPLLDDLRSWVPGAGPAGGEAMFWRGERRMYEACMEAAVKIEQQARELDVIKNTMSAEVFAEYLLRARDWNIGRVTLTKEEWNAHQAEIERLRTELAEHTPELITFGLALNLETYLNQGDYPMDPKGRQLAEEALAKYKALRGRP